MGGAFDAFFQTRPGAAVAFRTSSLQRISRAVTAIAAPLKAVQVGVSEAFLSRRQLHQKGIEVCAKVCCRYPQYEQQKDKVMSASSPVSFSRSQRVLHWLTAAFVFFNLLLPDGMNEWNRAMRHTGSANPEQIASANLHAYVGIAILVLVVLRLVLRLAQGVPPAPPQEPAIFKHLSKIAVATFYFLLIAMPLSGAAAYYLGYEGLGGIHADFLKIILWIVLAAHVIGALAHQFYWKTDVLRRMTAG